ncbi:hypothetical protein VYU27_010045, partial [Nannochloropsis oceanica]
MYTQGTSRRACCRREHYGGVCTHISSSIDSNIISSGNMGWFWPFYLTMAVLAFVPRLFLDRDPLFLYAPPSHFWWLRIKALLNPKEEFPPFTRGLLLFRLCLFMFNQ